MVTLIKQGLIQGKGGAESWLLFSLRRREGPHGVTGRESEVNPAPGLQEHVPHSREWGGSGDGKSSGLLFQDVIETGITHT